MIMGKLMIVVFTCRQSTEPHPRLLSWTEGCCSGIVPALKFPLLAINQIMRQGSIWRPSDLTFSDSHVYLWAEHRLNWHFLTSMCISGLNIAQNGSAANFAFRQDLDHPNQPFASVCTLLILSGWQEIAKYSEPVWDTVELCFVLQTKYYQPQSLLTNYPVSYRCLELMPTKYVSFPSLSSLPSQKNSIIATHFSISNDLMERKGSIFSFLLDLRVFLACLSRTLQMCLDAGSNDLKKRL